MSDKKPQPPFRLRLPDELMEIVRQNSCANERSLNSEIIYQLKTAYGMKQVVKEAA